MTAHPFKELRAEYERDIALVKTVKVDMVNTVAHRLIRPSVLSFYSQVEAKLAIPQVVQATICEREDSTDFSKNPAQGDPWNRASVHVPKGRGPFKSWIDAAIDAFHNVDHLDDNSAPWSLAYAMWKWEIYNGFGYRAHGRRSPYIYGGTNLQQPGKYTTDHGFDPNVMDTQLGCLPVALRMIELNPALAFGQAIATAAAAANDNPSVGPVPAGVGGNIKVPGVQPGADLPVSPFTGTKWVQDALNRVHDKLGMTFDPLTVDGSYGRMTRAAVREFRVLEKLPATGLVDDELCADLDKALAA